MIPDPVVYCRLDLEYDGAPFRGWSRQPGLVTVEGTLRDAIAQAGLSLQGLRCAGRTDAGVHARGQVASIAYTGPIPAERIGGALSKHLPSSVAVLSSAACDPAFDARSDACARSYEYRVLMRRVRSPLRAARTYHHPAPLDVRLLDAAAACVLGRHDFTAFTPTETKHRFFDRTVTDCRWERRGDELVLCITADSYLRHMVRVLVGTMLALGRGIGSLEQFAQLLDGAPRRFADRTAPPHGLCLMAVRYEAAPAGRLPEVKHP